MILGCGVLLIEVDFECTSFTRKCMNYLMKEEKYLNQGLTCCCASKFLKQEFDHVIRALFHIQFRHGGQSRDEACSFSFLTSGNIFSRNITLCLAFPDALTSVFHSCIFPMLPLKQPWLNCITLIRSLMFPDEHHSLSL